MSIPMDSRCLECHLRRNLTLARTLGTEGQAMAFARDLMRMYLAGPTDVGAPWFSPQTSRLFHAHYGLPLDRFEKERAQSNAFVLERLEDIRRRVQEAPDRVYAGLQFAVLGNYLDFSALQGRVSFQELEEMLDRALTMDLDRATYDRFRQDLSAGRRLLYLTDNAGEIGFDRLFAEALAEAHPHLEITFCVRGKITLNDATRADAAQVGIPFPVIDNGNDVPGTQMDLLSADARQALEAADVILAKGMANTETMYGCGLNVYYAFLVKCQRFVDLFGRELMTPMFVSER